MDAKLRASLHSIERFDWRCPIDEIPEEYGDFFDDAYNHGRHTEHICNRDARRHWERKRKEKEGKDDIIEIAFWKGFAVFFNIMPEPPVVITLYSTASHTHNMKFIGDALNFPGVARSQGMIAK